MYPLDAVVVSVFAGSQPPNLRACRSGKLSVAKQKKKKKKKKWILQTCLLVDV